MAVFALFTVELMAMRFARPDSFKGNDHDTTHLSVYVGSHVIEYFTWRDD